MLSYKYLLFDLDGTLTDPKIGITKSGQYALKQYGIEIADLDELIPMIGPPLHHSFMNIYGFDEAKAFQAVEHFRTYFKDKGIFENQVYEGIIELLWRLKEVDYQLIIATSKPTVFAEQIAKHFNFDSYFDMIVGSNLDGSRSDKAEVIGEVMRRLGINDASEMIMIGDRKHDIIGAAKNGLCSIGVLYGYGSLQEIEDSNPTYIVSTVQELEQLITGKELL